MGWDDFSFGFGSSAVSYTPPTPPSTCGADFMTDFSGADFTADIAPTFDMDCFMSPGAGSAATSTLGDFGTIDWSFDSGNDWSDPLAGCGITTDTQAFNDFMGPYGLGSAGMSPSLSSTSFDWGAMTLDPTMTAVDYLDPNCSNQDPTFLTPGAGSMDDGWNLLYQGGLSAEPETVASQASIRPFEAPQTVSTSVAPSAQPDNNTSIDITDAGRALADTFGVSQAWGMTKKMRDNPGGEEDFKAKVRDTLGRDLTPLELRDVEHYLYAASDVGGEKDVSDRALAAAKMGVLTTGYSALKYVAQHTGNTQTEKDAAHYWRSTANEVPTDGSTLNAAKYIGAKVLERIVSPIDIRASLGMGSNVRSSQATWSEFASGITGTWDGMFRTNKP